MIGALGELIECLRDVQREYPRAVLTRNLVGNLLIHPEPGEPAVGYVELMEAEWRRFEVAQATDAP